MSNSDYFKDEFDEDESSSSNNNRRTSGVVAQQQGEEEEEVFSPPPSAALFTQHYTSNTITNNNNNNTEYTEQVVTNLYDPLEQQQEQEQQEEEQAEEEGGDNYEEYQQETIEEGSVHLSQSKYPFIELSSFTTTSIEVIYDQLNIYSTPLFTIITTVNIGEEQDQIQTLKNNLIYKDHPLLSKTGLTVSRKMKDFEWLYDNLKIDCIGCLIPPKDLLTTNIDKLYEQTSTDPKILKGKYLSIFLSFCARHPILCKSYLFWDFIAGSDEEFNNTMKTQHSIIDPMNLSSNNNTNNNNNTNTNSSSSTSEKSTSSSSGGGGFLFNFKKMKFKFNNHDKEREYVSQISKHLKTMLNNSIQLKKYQEVFLTEFDSIGRAFKVYGNFEANNNFNDMMLGSNTTNNTTNNGNTSNNGNNTSTSSTLHNVFHAVGDLTMKLANVNSQQESTTQFEQYLLLYTKYLLPNLAKFLDLSKEYHTTLYVYENDLNKAQNNVNTNAEHLQKLKKQHDDMKIKVDKIDNRFPLEWEQFRYELKIDLQYSLLGSLVKRANDNVESIQYLKDSIERDKRKSLLAETYSFILDQHRKLILPTGSTNSFNL